MRTEIPKTVFLATRLIIINRKEKQTDLGKLSSQQKIASVNVYPKGYRIFIIKTRKSCFFNVKLIAFISSNYLSHLIYLMIMKRRSSLFSIRFRFQS